MPAIKFLPPEVRDVARARERYEAPDAPAPEHENYDDEITPETIAQLQALVPDEEFEDWITVSGPAW